jgi:hypothetical protein
MKLNVSRCAAMRGGEGEAGEQEQSKLDPLFRAFMHYFICLETLFCCALVVVGCGDPFFLFLFCVVMRV